VKRSEFLGVAAGLALIGATGGDLSIPVELRGGRFFAVPRTADGSIFACWLDTSGSGFVFDSSAARFRLATYASNGGRYAALPFFESSDAIPALVGATGLPIFERGASDRSDPILQGFDAQLGRTWFAGRIWRFDFVRGSLDLIAKPPSSHPGAVPLLFDMGYPYLRVEVEDDPALSMAFDTAASVAYAPAYAAGVVVQATSFIRHATLERWHGQHPQLPLDRNVGVAAGVDRIVVPRLRAGATEFVNVAFTTRPNDDVFEDSPRLDGKLGSNAYARSTVWADYPSARIWFES
jgi:hypothetical protein